MLERIEEILIQHKGKSNAIKSKEISKIIGYPMEDTQAATRKAIWKTAEQFGLPLHPIKAFLSPKQTMKLKRIIRIFKDVLMG